MLSATLCQCTSVFLWINRDEKDIQSWAVSQFQLLNHRILLFGAKICGRQYGKIEMIRSSLYLDTSPLLLSKVAHCKTVRRAVRYPTLQVGCTLQEKCWIDRHLDHSQGWACVSAE